MVAKINAKKKTKRKKPCLAILSVCITSSNSCIFVFRLRRDAIE
jgi:hypothetical protein